MVSFWLRTTAHVRPKPQPRIMTSAKVMAMSPYMNSLCGDRVHLRHTFGAQPLTRKSPGNRPRASSYSRVHNVMLLLLLMVLRMVLLLPACAGY